jgi:hypothetical protein
MKFIELTLVPEGTKRMYNVDCIESLVVEKDAEAIRIYLSNGDKNRVALFDFSSLNMIKSSAISNDELDGYFAPKHVVAYEDGYVRLTSDVMSLSPEAYIEFEKYLKGEL